MTYDFKYHGLVRNIAVFSIISNNESGTGVVGVDICHNHYKVDEHMNIQEITYLDKDLKKCHVTENRPNGITIPSRTNVVTERQSVAFLEALVERKVHLRSLGAISELPLRIVKNYTFKIVSSNGTEKFAYYDGIDEASAHNKARVCNSAAISIEQCEKKLKAN